MIMLSRVSGCGIFPPQDTVLSVTQVPGAGLEPARPTARDFKSRASTDSATRAHPYKSIARRGREGKGTQGK